MYNFTMDIDNIYKILKKQFDENKLKHSEFVDFMENLKNPYLVLICCILSLRTKDKITIGAAKRMLKLADNPSKMANIEVNELAHAIYPVGFYQNKAEQIVELSRLLVEKYNSIVPSEIDELTKFKGVGRKTANLVLTKGHNIPAICVDVHVHRICNRLGYVKTSKPDDTEMELRKILPKKYWIDFNTYLVTLGQNICKPQKPNCAVCPIEKYCKKSV